MISVATRLGFITVALTIAYGCGGSQQFAQTGSPPVQEDIVSTPLPGGAVWHRASAPFTHNLSGQRLLYIGDDDVGAVNVYPLTGPNQKQIGSITMGVKGPWGLSVDRNNALYVANSGNGTVTVYPYGSSAASMTYSKGVHRPLYALADSTGHVFVSGFESGDHHRGHVVEYNAGTNVPIANALLGGEVDGIALDSQGNLYAAYRHKGSNNASIAEFGPGLSNKRNLGMTINQPQGLLVDNAGNIVVVESAADTIEVFPPGATTPSVTLVFSTARGQNLAQLAMQDSETTLWVSSEAGNVYSMPYPLTPSTVPTEYEQNGAGGNGIAVTR
ncbi:MAG: hypothetical protein JO311_07620 [Candidatus Eremiobacteraeota bacterium]|nr:hypothetical protein [Candidatus Eremiobacteraeota bacterium]